MGTWNIGILETDAAMDVYGFFEQLYNEQTLDIEDIKTQTLQQFDLLTEHNQPVFDNEKWLAYAFICWECKALDAQTVSIVEQILANKEDIYEDWEELAEERIAEVQLFYEKIQTPPKRKKRIKKQYIVDVPFNVGDCILVKNEAQMYSVVILLDIDKTRNNNPNMWSYWIATTRIFQPQKPSMQDVVNSHLLVVNYGKTIDGREAYWIDKPTLWLSGRFIGDIKSEQEKQEQEEELSSFEIIGTLNIVNQLEREKSFGYFNLTQTFVLENQIAWEEEHPESIDLSFPVSKL